VGQTIVFCGLPGCEAAVARSGEPAHLLASGRNPPGRFGQHVEVKLKSMSGIKEIEEAVQSLSAAELAAFRAWFAEFDADAWDRRIEADIVSGRLDAIADEAVEDLRAGRGTER